MKDRTRKTLKTIAAAFAALALLVLLLLEFRYGALRSAPIVERPDLAREAGIVAVIDPAPVADHLAAFASGRAGIPVPIWLIEAFLPNEISVMTVADHDNAAIHVTGFLGPRRLGKEIERRANAIALSERAPEIKWAPDELTRPARGALVATGSIPMESEAQEASWYLWNQSFKPSPMPLEGGHFIEVVMDNRDGGAYAALASLLKAYDIELDKQETDISLSSLQFVLSARLTVDPGNNDTLRMRMAIEVKPEAVNRLGVINLKVGLTEILENWSERLATDHQLTVRGRVSWKENSIVFDYQILGAEEAVRLALEGRLF